MDATEACLQYMTARCIRQRECTGNSHECPTPEQVSACPALYSAPGTHTPESLLACADEVAAQACDEVRMGILSPCVGAGTRAAGESCAFSTQCASRTCRLPSVAGQPPGCGTCAALAREGESCANPETVCEPGTVCTAGMCTARTEQPFSRAEGELCDDAIHCQPPLGCVEQPGGEGRCAPWPSAPDACATVHFTSSRACAEPPCLRCDPQTSYCPGDGTSCRPRPVEGEPCGVLAEGSSGVCARGLYCNGEDVCARPPGAGEPCGIHFSSDTALVCDDSSYCAVGETPPRCRALPALGEPCVIVQPFSGSFIENAEDGQPRCSEGFYCCEGDCGPRGPRCMRTGLPGDACDDPDVLCVYTTACRDGVCSAVDGSELLAERCGP